MSGSVYSEECDVYLCNTSIQQGHSLNLASSLLSSFASSARSASSDSWNKHCLVVFDYGGDEVLICDADMDSAGDLTGRRYWKKKSAFEKFYQKKYLGRHRVPEEFVEKILKKMCDSGQYHPTKNNCQTWALDLLRQLGIKPPEEEPHAEKVVKEVIFPVATAVGRALFIGAGVLGALIWGNTRRNNRD